MGPLDSGRKPQEEKAVKQIIPVALVIGAVPALLSGQGVSIDCPEETCHVAPYYEGNGGFVGEAANEDDEDTADVDESEVTFFLLCGNVIVSDTVSPDSRGIVRQALTTANSLSCMAEGGGTLEIKGLKDGGWYWINDATNSAVSPLLPKDVLGNDQTEPTDPGGVTLSAVEDGAATLVKHKPSGRVGLIPHIIPEKPRPDCHGMVGEASAGDCHLGAGSDWSLVASPPQVVRPMGSDAPKEVTVTLMGTSFITSGVVYATADADYHSSVAQVTLESRTGEAPAAGEPGVLQWVLTVGADDDRCLPANSDPDRLNEQTVTVAVLEVEEVIPPLSEGIEVEFTINCEDDSAAAANLGAELAPGIPLPVD